MPEAHNALAGLIPAEPLTDPVIRQRRTGLHMLTVRGQADDRTLATAVTDATGGTLPTQPNTAIQTDRATLLWLAPDAWLAVSEQQQPCEQLAAAVTRAGGYALDSSHAHVAIRLQHENARKTLTRGCRLDLHPKAFAVDACTQTLLQHVSVLLHRSADDTFDLYVARSRARNTWLWLLESAASMRSNASLPR